MSNERFAARLAAHLRARPRPPAVVLGSAWVNGLAAIRSLGRAGVPVVAVDHAPWALGFRSRYALPLVCPDPAADEDGFAACLARLGEAIGRPAVVFPTHDPELNALSRRRGELAERFLYPFPAPEPLARIQSKRHQLEAAEAAGVAVPLTAHPASASEALAHAAAVGYPVLVKPSDPDGFKRRFQRQAFRCESPAELERAYADAEAFAPMVQELVPGGDEELYTLGSYLAGDGEPLGLFCGRKLAQEPPGIGTCRVGEAVWLDEVVESGLAVLRALACHGISQVELKHDARDGRFKLMEVNPRLWQWHGLATACGVDLPVIAYRDLNGDRPSPVRMRGEGKRWAISVLAKRRPAFQRPPYVDAVLAVDDPLPAAVQLVGAVRGSLR